MTNTTTTYLSIVNNLARAQTTTSKLPDVTTATKYYQDNIGKVTSVKDFVNNYRLLSYALTAFGMEDQIQNKGLIQRLLEGGVTNKKSLANTMTDKRFLTFAKAFDFTGSGAASVSTSSAISSTTSAYVQQKLEDNAGQQDQGVQLALYFKRVASSLTDPYTILGNKNLTTVIRTALDLPATTSADALDNEAAAIKKALNGMKDLQDPVKVNKLAERFTANYDMQNASTSTDTANVATLFSMASSSTTTMSETLLSSIQNLKLGGF